LGEILLDRLERRGFQRGGAGMGVACRHQARRRIHHAEASCNPKHVEGESSGDTYLPTPTIANDRMNSIFGLAQEGRAG